MIATLLMASLAVVATDVGTGLRVSASDARGAYDAQLAQAVAEALVDVGLSARPSAGPARCRNDCTEVRVRQVGDRMDVEVRSRGQTTTAPLSLDPTASSFDRAHAVAIHVVLLTSRTGAAHRRPPPPEAPTCRDATTAPQVALASPAPAATAPPDRQPTVAAEPPAAASGDPHVGLDVAATVLISPSGGLFMQGVGVGVAVRVSRSLELRGGASLLRPQRVRTPSTRLHRELFPLQLSVTARLPGLPGLSAGVGVEAVSVSGDHDGEEPPSWWSLGAVVRAGYRRRLRSFSLVTSVQAAFHHPSWMDTGDPSPVLVLPGLTVAASLGLGFKVF
jgi:hypothetical protein